MKLMNSSVFFCFLSHAFILINLLCLTGFFGFFAFLVGEKAYAVGKIPQGIATMHWPLRRTQLNALYTFKVEGYFELHSPQYRSLDCLFKWEQNADYSRLKFLDKNGYMLLEMKSTPKHSEVHIKGKVYSGKNAESLIQKYLNISIPLNHFKHWLKGASSPDVRHERVLNSTQHLLTFKSSWVVDSLFTLSSSAKNGSSDSNLYDKR